MAIILKKMKGKPVQREESSADWKHLLRLIKIVLILFIVFSGFHLIIKKKVQQLPAQPSSATHAVNSKQAPGTKVYTVKAGDTLWSIAIKQYPNEDPSKKTKEIEQLNQLHNDSIKPGHLIKLP